jgi:hypothetical protein
MVLAASTLHQHCVWLHRKMETIFASPGMHVIEYMLLFACYCLHATVCMLLFACYYLHVTVEMMS